MSQPGAAQDYRFLVKEGLEGVNPDELCLLGFVDGVPMLDMERDVLEDIKFDYQDIPVGDHLETIFGDEVKAEPEELGKEVSEAPFVSGQKVLIKYNKTPVTKSVIFNHKTGKVEIPTKLPSLQVKPSPNMRHRPTILKSVRAPFKYEIASKKPPSRDSGLLFFANRIKEQMKFVPVKENIEFNNDHDYSVRIRDVAPPEREEAKPNVVLCYAPGRGGNPGGNASGAKEDKVIRNFSLVMDNNFYKPKTLQVSSMHAKGPFCKKGEETPEVKKLKTYEIVKPRKSPKPPLLFVVPRKEPVLDGPPHLEHFKGQEHKCTQAGVQRKDAATSTDESLLDSLIEQRALERAQRNKKHQTTNTDVDEFALSSPLSSFNLPDDFLENLDDTVLTEPLLPVPNATLLDISHRRGKAVNGCLDARASNGTPPADRWKLHLFEDLKCCQKFDASGNMPLHNAVIQNDMKLVGRQCLALKIRRVDINTPNHSSYTALQLALLHDVNPGIIQLLLSSDADTSVVDSNGNNIYHLCVSYSNERALKVLLQAAVQADINECNFEGFTPLIVSTMYQKYVQTDDLLSAGADPNISDKKSGRTPLFHAVENNDGEMVRLLLNYKAQTKMKNYFGTSPYDAMFELDSVNPQIQDLILHNSDARKNLGVKKRKGNDQDKPYAPKRRVHRT